MCRSTKHPALDLFCLQRPRQRVQQADSVQVEERVHVGILARPQVHVLVLPPHQRRQSQDVRQGCA